MGAEISKGIKCPFCGTILRELPHCPNCGKLIPYVIIVHKSGRQYSLTRDYRLFEEDCHYTDYNAVETEIGWTSIHEPSWAKGLPREDFRADWLY